MNPQTIPLFVRLALVLLATARDWADSEGQLSSEIIIATRARADKAIKEGEEFLASLPS